MNRNIRPLLLMFALAVVLVIGIAAQQQSADKAIDPVCGMTVVKATAKATYDYKGTTYYFCNPGCKDAFAKDPEKYLKAAQEKAAAPAAMGGMQMQMRHAQGQPMPQAGAMAGGCSCESCPMKAQGGGMMGGGMGRMGMMHRGMGMAQGPMKMAGPGLGRMFQLYGDKIDVVVENTKDGAALKVTSKDPEVVKAIQVHMAEHIAMMRKMKEEAKTPAAATGIKAPAESAGCANCATKK